MSETAVVIDYTNYRGERALRPIEPTRILFGSTPWHPDPQWLLEAWDITKNEHRSFALNGIPGWHMPKQATIEASIARQLQASMERNSRMVNRLQKLQRHTDAVWVSRSIEAILKDEEPTW